MFGKGLSPWRFRRIQVGEVGELSEIFQWKGEVPKGLPDWKEEEKQHLGEELSDVLLYLVRLSDICGIDLGKAALRKVDLNAIKYPVSNKESSQSHWWTFLIYGKLPEWVEVWSAFFRYLLFFTIKSYILVGFYCMETSMAGWLAGCFFAFILSLLLLVKESFWQTVIWTWFSLVSNFPLYIYIFFLSFMVMWKVWDWVWFPTWHYCTIKYFQNSKLDVDC